MFLPVSRAKLFKCASKIVNLIVKLLALDIQIDACKTTVVDFICFSLRGSFDELSISDYISIEVFTTNQNGQVTKKVIMTGKNRRTMYEEGGFPASGVKEVARNQRGR